MVEQRGRSYKDKLIAFYQEAIQECENKGDDENAYLARKNLEQILNPTSPFEQVTNVIGRILGRVE